MLGQHLQCCRIIEFADAATGIIDKVLVAIDLLRLADRLRLDLPNTLAGNIELLAHLFGVSGEELLTTRILKISSQDSEGQKDGL